MIKWRLYSNVPIHFLSCYIPWTNSDILTKWETIIKPLFRIRKRLKHKNLDLWARNKLSLLNFPIVEVKPKIY